jgi:hypothetical protein
MIAVCDMCCRVLPRNKNRTRTTQIATGLNQTWPQQDFRRVVRDTLQSTDWAILKGCVFEGRVVQKRAGSRMDVLLLGLIDYPCRVEAVSLYEHESRRRGVLDRKN